MLKLRGQDVSEGAKIEYVVLDYEATDPVKRFLPAGDYTGQVDRHYLWESLVYPATQRLLTAAFPAHEKQWDAWSRSRPPKLRGRKQEAAAGELFGERETRVSEPPRPLVKWNRAMRKPRARSARG